MNTRSRALAIGWFVLTAASAFGQDGAYDPTFGNAGRTWIDVTSSSSDQGYRLIPMPNGNLFMGGACYPSTSVGESCVAWLTPSGVLANGYGPSGNGTAWLNSFTGWPKDETGISSLAAFPDGRVAIVAVKDSSGGYVGLLRQNGTGLDASVGNGAGYIAPAFTPLLVRITPQSQLIVVGVTGASQDTLLVTRLNSDFRVDTTFGTGGSTTLSFPDGGYYPEGMTLQRDGKIVTIGGAGFGMLGITRMTASGQPDAAFGVNSDGRFETNFGIYSATGKDIVEDKQGRLVFAGEAGLDNSADAEWLVGRLLSGGAIDPSFNGGSPQTFIIVGSTKYNLGACCVALQSDNRIVVAGSEVRPTTDPSLYFGIARFNENGAFDSTYGVGGESYGDLSPEGANVESDSVSSMILVPGGVVVAGHTSVQSNETRFSAAKETIELIFADDFE